MMITLSVNIIIVIVIIPLHRHILLCWCILWRRVKVVSK